MITTVLMQTPTAWLAIGKAMHFDWVTGLRSPWSMSMSIAANSIFDWRKGVAERAPHAVRVRKAVAVHALVASQHGVPDHGAKEKSEHADVGICSTRHGGRL